MLRGHAWAMVELIVVAWIGISALGTLGLCRAAAAGTRLLEGDDLPR